MIANDVLDSMRSLIERLDPDDGSTVDLLLGLGVAPDEVNRFIALSMWRPSQLDATRNEGVPLAAASWLDGFALGVETARRERPPTV